MARRKLVANINDKILDECMRLAMHDGLAVVSTRDIARYLSISEPVIFTHFKTKMGLINATYARAFSAFDGTIILQGIDKNLPEEEAYRAVEPQILQSLKHKKELSFINQYAASLQYYDYDFVQQVQAHYRTVIIDLFKSFWPHAEGLDFDLLANQYIEDLIAALYHVAMGDYPNTERTRRMLQNLILYGIKGSIRLDLENEGPARV
jgi:AcrR family transcriptional regulator